MSADEKRFFQADLTTSLFVWLRFSQSIDQSIDQQELAASETLGAKIASIQTEQSMISHIGLFLGLTGLLFGFVAVSSIVGYSNAQPANLWLVIVLFAGWPMFTAILSFLTDHQLRSSAILQLLFKWIKRNANLPLPESTTSVRAKLILQWLSWRWQLFSIGFVLGSFIGFLVIILFWDISFGWSSTLNNSQQWMEPLIRLITWPGHWLLGAPTNELINASQLTRYNPTQEAVLLRQWWPHVLFCIFLYGLVSRLLLLIWKYYRLKSAIVSDIRTSGAIERYQSKQAERASVFTPITTIKPGADPLSQGELSDLSQGLVFGWQLNQINFNLVHNFGVASWQQDIDWLAQFDWPKEGSDTIVLVNIHQTPVIELIDLVEKMEQVTCNAGVNIGVFISKRDRQNIPRFEGTWKQFAQKNSHITFIRYIENET